MNAIGASILTVAVLVILFGPRRWALMAIMAGVLYVPSAQALEVLNFHVFAMRFLEFAGFIRVVSRREVTFFKLNRIDLTVLLLYAFTVVVYSLRSAEGVVYMIGVAVDAWLCYFTFRGLLVDLEEFRWFLRALVVLLAPFAMLVLIEGLTRYNVFAAIENGATGWERSGRLRCVGSFRHPDLLGTVGASFLPLYIALACEKMRGIRIIIAIGACLVIVWASNSGGPACAAAVALAGWLCWRIRTNMRVVRWSIIAVIVLAALLMKAPVWYLLARASSVTGGDGWHRAYLMDVSFRHLGEWWFDGLPSSATKEWFAYSLSDGGADITNGFLSFGLTAGLGAMILFIVLLVQCFKSLGRALASIRYHADESNEDEFLLWGLGVMVAVHIINWFGITYFDKLYVVWFLQLTAIAKVSERYYGGERITAAETRALPEPALWPDEIVAADLEIDGRNAGASSLDRNESRL
jgi:hypothetical protein